MASTVIFAALALVGFLLSLWAAWVNPRGARLPPGERPVGVPLLTSGPYAIVRHPMYVGTALISAGLAGLAAGWWNVLAVGGLAATLMRDWAARDEA